MPEMSAVMRSISDPFRPITRPGRAVKRVTRTLAQARGRYGDLLYRQGRYAEAEPHLVASYEAWFEIAGENIVSAQLRARIASLYDQLGRTDEARIYRTTSALRDDP